MNINRILPEELRSTIFSHLHTDEQERCRLVCRRWNRTIVSLSNSKLRKSFEKVLDTPCGSILHATSLHGQFIASLILINQHLAVAPPANSSQIMRQLAHEIGPTFVLVKLLKASGEHEIEKKLFSDLCRAKRSSQCLRRFAQLTSSKMQEIVEKYLIRKREYQEAEKLVGAQDVRQPEKRAQFEDALLQANALDYLLGYQRRVKVNPNLLQELGEKLIAAKRFDEAEGYFRTIALPDVEYKLKKRLLAHFVTTKRFEKACSFFTENFPTHYLSAYDSFFQDLVKNGQSDRAWQVCREANKETLFALLVRAEAEEGHSENAYRVFNEIQNPRQKMIAAKILTYYEARNGNIQRSYELGSRYVWGTSGLVKSVLIKAHLYIYRFARSIDA